MAKYTKNSPYKLTPHLIWEISKLIQLGAYIETAVAMVGISKDTFYRWLRQARSPNPPPLVIELSDAVRVALAESEVRDLQRLEIAAEHDWRAAAWRLERRFPEKWGRISGKGEAVRAASIDKQVAESQSDEDISETIAHLKMCIAQLEANRKG